MAAIRVVSTTTIQARSQFNNGDLPQEIGLSSWDLQFLLSEYGQKAVLFHKPTLSSSSSSSVYTEKTIQHLKDSLSSSLDFYPPLAGRFAIAHHGGDDDTFSVSVTCNNAGASFVHAIADNITIADIIEPPYVPPFVHSFFPLYRSKNIEGSRIPLLAVQVTELVDGIFMACSMNHCLADVKPFWDFLNTWSSISRHGLNYIGSNSKLASFKRWFPQGKIARPVRIPLREIMGSDGKLKGSIGSHQAFPFSQRIFHFKRKKIVELTEKANLEVADGHISHKISSLQALSSHVWGSMIKNQDLDPEEVVTYRFFVAAGPRISDPPIPRNYFGPTVQHAFLTMKVRDLVGDRGLGKFALEMNRVISSFTEENIKKDFEAWARNPTMPLQSGPIGKFMGTSSSPRTNFYAIDFGWGRPVVVHSCLPSPKNWKLVVDAGAEEDSLDIDVYASFEMLEALASDTEFMRAVSPRPVPAPAGGISSKLAQARL